MRPLLLRCTIPILPLLFVWRCDALTVPPQKQPPRSASSKSAAEDASPPPVPSFAIRPATPDEATAARKILLRNAMNPTSVSAEYLLVAVLPSSATVTAPHGIERANDDREIEQEGEMVVGFGQIRPLDATYSELASLYVDPAHRRRGVGTEIIKELLRRYDDGTLNAKRTTSPSESQPTGGGTVCLLTLQPTVPFYVPHGFRAVAADEEAFRRLPSSVRLEHATGTALSALLGNQLACMVRDPAK